MTRPPAKAARETPHTDDDGVPLDHSYAPDAWALLAPRLTPERRARFVAAVERRTRQIRLVIQDVHQPHNVSACMRSADAFGVQDVDVVTLSQTFKISSVARGVGDWLTLRRHRTVEACITSLRRGGYKIAAAVPRPDAVSLYDLPPTERIAVVFGNEHSGISNEWLPHVDLAFTIPMVGLVESLNVSVSAAITLNQLTRAGREAMPADQYHVPSVQHEELLSRWLCRNIRSWKGEVEHLRGE